MRLTLVLTLALEKEEAEEWVKVLVLYLEGASPGCQGRGREGASPGCRGQGKEETKQCDVVHYVLATASQQAAKRYSRSLSKWINWYRDFSGKVERTFGEKGEAVSLVPSLSIHHFLFCNVYLWEAYVSAVLD